LILASIVDAAASTFARELADTATSRVLTCRDLAENRLVVRHPDFAASTLTVGDREISIDEISGVLNLLPAVFPEELIFYPPEEQDYQAAEFHALLTFLLNRLACPVVNRPAGGSLAGAFVSPLSWRHLAWRAGIPAAPLDVDTDDVAIPFRPPRSSTAVEVRCLAGRVLAPSGTAADHYSLLLARHAGTDYLRALYDNAGGGAPELVMVSTVPDLGNIDERRALIELFAGVSGRS
jgi:hypothetical protein